MSYRIENIAEDILLNPSAVLLGVSFDLQLRLAKCRRRLSTSRQNDGNQALLESLHFHFAIDAYVLSLQMVQNLKNLIGRRCLRLGSVPEFRRQLEDALSRVQQCLLAFWMVARQEFFDSLKNRPVYGIG